MVPVRQGRLEKDKRMSFNTYYNRLVSQGKQGTPTAEEARRDFSAILAQGMRYF